MVTWDILDVNDGDFLYAKFLWTTWKAHEPWDHEQLCYPSVIWTSFNSSCLSHTLGWQPYKTWCSIGYKSNNTWESNVFSISRCTMIFRLIVASIYSQISAQGRIHLEKPSGWGAWWGWKHPHIYYTINALSIWDGEQFQDQSKQCAGMGLCYSQPPWALQVQSITAPGPSLPTGWTKIGSAPEYLWMISVRWDLRKPTTSRMLKNMAAQPAARCLGWGIGRSWWRECVPHKIKC